MNRPAGETPPIAPFVRRMNRLDPELSREMAGLRGREEGTPVSWLDSQPARQEWLNDAGRQIQQAYRESTPGLGEEQLMELTRDLTAILACPAHQELANLHDRALILSVTGDEAGEADLRKEVRALDHALGVAQERVAEGLRENSPETLANGLKFIQHIRMRAARQIRGLPADPEEEQE